MNAPPPAIRADGPRGVRAACIAAAALCAGLAALHGVRWDEHYEFAQLLTGAVPLDDGHPFKRAVFNAGNIQAAAFGWLMRLYPGPSFVNGAANAVQLAAAILPVYLAAVFLTRRAVFGALAAILVLYGYADAFSAAYPIHTWPGAFHSTGQIGRGAALLALALLIGGFDRSGGLAFGLLPILHIAHMPPLLAWCVVWYGWMLWRRKYRRAGRFAAGCAAGLALCLLYSLAAASWVLPDPVTGPYASQAGADAIWRGLIAADPHRALPGGPVSYGNAAAASACVLTIAACAFAGRRRLHSAWYALSLYAFLTVAIVVAIMAIHAAAGAMPFVLIAWMPYRLTNHLVFLWPCLAVAVLASRPPSVSSALVLTAAALWPLLRIAGAATLPETLTSRYIEPGAAVVFLLTGAAIARLLSEQARSRAARTVQAAFAVSLAILLSVLHQFGLACFIVGAAAYLGASAFSPADSPRTLRPLAAAVALGLVAIAFQAYRRHEHLPVYPHETALIAALERGEPGDAFVVPPTRYLVQGKTGHPVLMDGPLPLWISYMPSVGPSIQTIMHDIYGIRYDGPSANWQTVWRERSPEEWRALASVYDFRWVLSPVPLRWPSHAVVGVERLYRIEAAMHNAAM